MAKIVAELDINIKRDCLNHKGGKMDYHNPSEIEARGKIFSGEDFKLE